MHHVSRSLALTDGFRPMFLQSSSNNLGVELLLADIPFFSAGLLAFGVITFLFFMKCVTLLSVYLYASALLAFIGSVVDLIPILALSNSSNKSRLDNTFNTFFLTRGTLFALSIGFRFLFFWAFVAQPPNRGRQPSNFDMKKGDSLMLRDSRHSASWGRWGIIGFVLKWLLLTLTIAIIVFEILWRNVSRFQRSLYFVGSAIETVVAALFMLKIALNILVSPDPMKFTVLYYLAPLFALGISASLSVTNILVFIFSETTPGRFLQAIELYILIVYNLTCTFYPPATILPTQRKTNATFRRPNNRPPGAAMDPSPSAQGVPGAVMLIGRNPYPPSESSRLSYLSMVSQRLPSVFRSGSRRQSREAKIRDQNSADLSRMRPLNIRTLDLGPRVEDLMDIRNWKLATTVTDPPSEPPIPSITATIPSREKADDGVVVVPEPETSIPGTSFSMFSFYGRNRYSGEPATTQSESIESPVYGLNGPSRAGQMSLESTPRFSSVTSIDDLLRKQRELDKSIEALRLFSPESTAAKLPTTTFPSITRADSTSMASELSLSNFPVPPAISKRSSATMRPAPRRSQRQKAHWQRAERPGVTPAPPPIVIPPVDEDINGKLPQTVGGTGETGHFHKFDSMGTQYDVTSFIGDFSGPSDGIHTGLTSAMKSSRLSDVPSVDERSQATITTTNVKRPRPMIITSPNTPSSGPSIYSSPATASSGLLQPRTGQSSAQSNMTPLRSASSVTSPGEPIPGRVRPAALLKPRGLPALPTGPHIVAPRPATGKE